MKTLSLVSLLFALGACYTPAPPPEVSAEALFMSETSVRALETAKRNQDAVNKTWSGKLRDKADKAAEGVLEARIAGLLADPSSRPSAASILEEIKFVDGLKAANEAEIEKTLAKLRDPNLDLALETMQAFRELFTDLTERDKKLAVYKKMFQQAAGLPQPESK